MRENPEELPAPNGNAQSDSLDELPLAYVELDDHGMITRANRLTRAQHSEVDWQDGLGTDADR
jgi:hypothetical protein